MNMMTQEFLTNAFLLILLIAPAYSFIRTIYHTYTNELFAKMAINIATFIICFVLFILIFQFLWLPNKNNAGLVDYILKVASAFVFLPSVIINAKLLETDNKNEKNNLKENENEQ